MTMQTAITVLSWNCLADCYSQGASVRKQGSSKGQSCIDWSFRSKKIAGILRDANAGIVCLQEVDHFHDFYKPVLKSLSYIPVYLQRRGRKDGVLIAVKESLFEIVQNDEVHFDDLTCTVRQNISDTQRARLLKKNVALILLIRKKVSDLEQLRISPCFTVCTTHMHWNPLLPQVKLAQTKYLLERIANIRDLNGLHPYASILTGDFNSMPTSDTYQCVQEGFLLRQVPFGCKAAIVQKVFDSLSSKALMDGERDVRFICDASLVKLARWMRLLGIDAAVEDKLSEERRVRCNDFNRLFSRARTERRVIVTTSTGLSRRASCPETFLVKMPKSRKLENCLAALLNCYNVNLDPAKFLTRCGKCGGTIEDCADDDDRVGTRSVPNDRNLYICTRCSQVYWWSSSKDGVSARAKRLAERLLDCVENSESSNRRRLRLGHLQKPSPISNPLCTCKNEHPEEHVSESMDLSEQGGVEQQNKPRLRFTYTSALHAANGMEPTCTNINGSFRGTLDYIFFGGALWIRGASVQNSTVPNVASNSVSLPNFDWPSDHMLLSASFVMQGAAARNSNHRRSLSSPV